jgi:predicted carbohydrate-binding protein with CBM5 and CBM33 domain
MAALAASIAVAPLLVVIMPANPASAHGWVTNPPSRQENCARGRVANCGDIEYEPQSVEAPKGARSCSGGSRFTVLDDESRPWPVANVGSTVSITWRLTAAHRTTTWQYYVGGRLLREVDQGNTQPPFDVTHTISGVPGGRQKILAIWNIGDTPMAFYACIDVQVGGGGSPPPPPPPPGNPPPPSGCGPAWDRSAVYTGGMQVAHRGNRWRAKWWTQGEEPGTTGEWGVWAGLGAC